MAPGLKVAKLMLSGKAGVVRHMAGVFGKGDTLINFDPKEGEVLFDAEGYKRYLRDHRLFYEQSCSLVFCNVRARPDLTTCRSVYRWIPKKPLR
jgi:hypothetical protein